MATTLSFRTAQETRQQIDKVAESLDRDRSWVINEAVASYLELYDWQLQQIDEGIKELDAGKGYTLDEVREHLSKLQKTKTKAAGKKKNGSMSYLISPRALKNLEAIYNYIA